jgi:hypothetical protein
MCLHCVRPALRKGCLNPIARAPDGGGPGGDAPDLAPKSGSCPYACVYLRTMGLCFVF